jgi:hypothetical protein
MNPPRKLRCKYASELRFEPLFRIRGVDDKLRLLKPVEHAGDIRRQRHVNRQHLRGVLTNMVDCGVRPSKIVTMRREQR